MKFFAEIHDEHVVGVAMAPDLKAARVSLCLRSAKSIIELPDSGKGWTIEGADAYYQARKGHASAAGFASAISWLKTNAAVGDSEEARFLLRVLTPEVRDALLKRLGEGLPLGGLEPIVFDAGVDNWLFEANGWDRGKASTWEARMTIKKFEDDLDEEGQGPVWMVTKGPFALFRKADQPIAFVLDYRSGTRCGSVAEAVRLRDDYLGQAENPYHWVRSLPNEVPS